MWKHKLKIQKVTKSKHVFIINESGLAFLFRM